MHEKSRRSVQLGPIPEGLIFEQDDAEEGPEPETLGRHGPPEIAYRLLLLEARGQELASERTPEELQSAATAIGLSQWHNWEEALSSYHRQDSERVDGTELARWRATSKNECLEIINGPETVDGRSCMGTPGAEQIPYQRAEHPELDTGFANCAFRAMGYEVD